jgi:hypothetical protein
LHCEEDETEMKLLRVSSVMILLLIIIDAYGGKFDCHKGFCRKECGRYWNARCYVRGVTDDEKYVKCARDDQCNGAWKCEGICGWPKI